jgi:hypothetical protein
MALADRSRDLEVSIRLFNMAIRAFREIGYAVDVKHRKDGQIHFRHVHMKEELLCGKN